MPGLEQNFVQDFDWQIVYVQTVVCSKSVQIL